jgi:hypothetical protein
MKKIILIILLALIPLAPFIRGIGEVQAQDKRYEGTVRGAHFITRDTLLGGTTNWVKITKKDGTAPAGKYAFINVWKIDTGATKLDSTVVVMKNKYGDSTWATFMRTETNLLSSGETTTMDIIYNPFVYDIYIKFADAVVAAGRRLIITVEGVE